ncbi:MAG: hypothetical protein HOP11_06820 [Saprospiraceae bacterium]|nr:hypothetical protein [Saprospiraceae bacterium]
MKNLIILIFMLSNSIYAQEEYSFDYCINKLDIIKDCYESQSPDSCNLLIKKNLDSLEYHFSKVMFIQNDSLINLSIDSSEIQVYLEENCNIPDADVYIDTTDYIPTYSCKLNNYLNDYKISIQFNNLSTVELLDSLNAPGLGKLIKYVVLKTNTSELITIFNNSSKDLKFQILHSIIYGINKTITKFDSLFSCIDSTLQNDLSKYSYKHKYAMLYSDTRIRDSLVAVVKHVFDSKLDTSTKENHDWYLRLFRTEEYNQIRTQEITEEVDMKLKNLMQKRDSIFQIRKHKVDSFFQNHVLWDQMQPHLQQEYRRMFETGEIYKTDFYTKPTSPPDTNRMSSNEKWQYKVSRDTTLYTDNGYARYYPGDDGRRFDTLSNVALVAELAQFDYHQIRASSRVWRSACMDSIREVIYLRKITQLIGDRAMYGTLSLDSNQRIEINRLIDFCGEVYDHDTNHIWSTECEEMLLRLWFPIKPRLLSLVGDTSYTLRRFIDSYLHAFLTEEDAIQLALIATNYLNQGERNKALPYVQALEPIADFLHVKDGLSSFVPPRRKGYRTWEQSVKWCGDFIYDVLAKAGYPK